LCCSTVTWDAVSEFIEMSYPDHHFAILAGMAGPGNVVDDPEGFTLVGGGSSKDPLRVWLEGNLRMDWLAGRIPSLPPPVYDLAGDTSGECSRPQATAVADA
jgi:hypothetical protein